MTNAIDPSIFRAYDIRGIVDKDLTENAVRLIGQAIGSEALDRGEPSVIIGRDGRLSGPKLSKALCEGILSSGCDVIDIGAIPTPLVYFATNILSSRSGVALTGSHNPPDYNGLKIVIAGETYFNELIQKLYQRIIQNDLRTGAGKYSEENVIERYLKTITDHIHLAKPLKIVIDCGNGIGGLIAPTLFKRLGCEVTELFCDVDGHFPNHHPDPSEPKNLKMLIQTVLDKKADVGLAFDGDADRLGVITNQGEIIWADRQLMLYAIDVLSRNPGAEIIYDVKCTRLLAEVITQHGGKPLMWKTGHSFIKSKMKETGDLLAGEMSGHLFFKERWFGFDDGIYGGVRLLEILAKQNLSSSEIFKRLPNSVNTPELKLPISESEKISFMERFQKEAKFENAKLTTIDGVRVDYPDSFGLIRPSNTTPYLILRFEANDAAGLKKIQDLFRVELLQINPDLKLPF